MTQALDLLIEQLASADVRARQEAAHGLGDSLYSRAGTSDDEARRIHQALLDAATSEADYDTVAVMLGALQGSNRPLIDLVGWDVLAERAPDLHGEPCERALDLLSLTNDPAIADGLEGALERFDPTMRPSAKATVDLIRGCHPAPAPRQGDMRQNIIVTGLLAAAAVVAVAAFSTLAGCMPVVASPPAVEAPMQSVDATACAARGGELRRVGRMQSQQCIISYADAGKRCTDGVQCAGDCRIEANSGIAPGASAAGVCQADSDRFGCHTVIEDGKAGATLCVD